MKYPLLALTLGTFALVGCGSDDNHAEESTPTPPPPVEKTVNIDEATQINLIVERFEPNTGTVLFSLADASQTAITAAKNYDIDFFGFPDKSHPSSHPKAWKRWHVTQNYRCHSKGECSGKLTEIKNGQYQFEIVGLDWQQHDPNKLVSHIKIAIQIYGAKAQNQLDLITVAPQ